MSKFLCYDPPEFTHKSNEYLIIPNRILLCRKNNTIITDNLYWYEKDGNIWLNEDFNIRLMFSRKHYSISNIKRINITYEEYVSSLEVIVDLSAV